MKPLIVIVGPTASGKTSLALDIAKRYNGEIICADSRTVYKGMDIGTAKPTLEERSKIPHHLLDVVSPDQTFNAAKFQRLAREAINNIRARGKLPVMVGGTGLYVDSVIFDYQFGSLAEPSTRRELLSKTVEELQQICRYSHIDIPINSKNKRHLVRAIELGGLPKLRAELIANTLVVGIATENEELRERITARAHAMLSDGILQEIKSITDRYGWDSEAMKSNIYRVFKDVLAGSKTVDQGIQEFIASDMALAKRQRTWLKRNPAIIWGTPEELEKVIDGYIRAAS